MDYNEMKEIIVALREDGIDLKDIEEELEYRDNSNLSWDDNLCEFSTEELEDIERLWCEV